jgi:HEAT repeat protein
MGVSATFAVLAGFPPGQRLLYCEAALREPFVELQSAAFDELASPERLNRPDLVVQHYPELLPELRRRVAERGRVFRDAARDALSSESEFVRRAGYEVLAAVGQFAAAPELGRALGDASALVRESAADILEGLCQRYFYHVVAWRLTGDEASRKVVEENRPLLLSALPDLLRTYPQHQKRIVLDVAIESDPDAYPLITDVALARRDGPTYAAFVQALSQAPTEAAVQLLLKLYLEHRPRYREIAIEVMKARKDPGFPALLAAALSRLGPERFENAAARFRELPWWPTLEAALPDLDPASASRLVELLARSGLEPEQRNTFLFAFHRSGHPEVRIRALAKLHELGASALLDYATGFLEDPSEEVKIAAVRTILALNPPNKERFLLPLLNSPNLELRRLATREVSQASFEKFLRSFDKLDPKTRELAAKALAKIDPKITERLAEEITSLDVERRLKALRVVDYVEAEEELRSVLVELLSDPDRRVRATVIRIVQLSGSADGMRLLIGALGDPDSRVRANAIEAFEDAGDSRYASLLSPFLNDPDNRARANAAKALWSLGRRDEARRTLEAMLKDPRELMRLSAVWALGELRYEGASARLLDLAAEESAPAVRAKIADVLSRMSEEAVPPGGGA